MSKKITFVGAGSIGFTRKLVGDILTVPEFRDLKISFTDINKNNLDMVAQLCQRDIIANGLDIKIHSTLNRREALEGADYVFNVVRIGGIEAFGTDVEIPMKYGVNQCVGDTLCAGGIMYGQRGISAILDFCRDIREVASDDVLMLNYANPNAMMIWYISIKHKGEDVAPLLLDALKKHPEFSKTEKVRIDILERFGYFSTESNGHLSEYVAWYRKRPEEIDDWISYDTWIHGEPGGYLRVCTKRRNSFDTDFPKWMEEEPSRYFEENRSNEHGSYILEGLETGRIYRGHFNVVNNGCISNLPDDAVVEVPGYVDANGQYPFGGRPSLGSGCCLQSKHKCTASGC